MSDFNITLSEACKLLNRSKKSISRYIRQGLLHPEKIKSQQGTLEYRFSKADIEAFKAREAQNAEGTRETGHTKSNFVENKDIKDILEQTRQDTSDKTGHDGEVITLLKETIELLKEQLAKKDEQIKDLGWKIDQLIERDRETNILIEQLQRKILMLEKPKGPINNETTEETRQDKMVKKGFFERIKDFFKETK